MKKRKLDPKTKKTILLLILLCIVLVIQYFLKQNDDETEPQEPVETLTLILDEPNIELENIPEYNGTPYVILNNNIPFFETSDYVVEAFETYSELDSLGRCGVAYANICIELMPEGERESISNVKPTGWQTQKYPGVVDGNYLYNRCHLIGYQLAGENANKKNLITGTRYMNVQGMLPFENEVDDYIEQNEDNHVLYRVTPIFEGNNLVADGVQMEAYSIEDNGEGVCFNVFVYNVQPGIVINYATGESRLAD